MIAFYGTNIRRDARKVDCFRPEPKGTGQCGAVVSRGPWTLICTGLMSRRIVFKSVNVVVNFHFSPSTITYAH